MHIKFKQPQTAIADQLLHINNYEYTHMHTLSYNSDSSNALNGSCGVPMSTPFNVKI